MSFLKITNCRGGRPSSASAPRLCSGWKGPGTVCGCGTWGHGLKVNVAVLGNGGTFPAQRFHEQAGTDLLESLLAESQCLSEPGEIPLTDMDMDSAEMSFHTPSVGLSSCNPRVHAQLCPSPAGAKGSGFPAGFWSRGLAGLPAVPVSSGARAGSLGSFGCSFPLCFPPGNGSLPWLSTFPLHSALMRQWHGTPNNCFVYLRLTRLVLIMYTLTSPVFFIKALIKT